MNVATAAAVAVVAVLVAGCSAATGAAGAVLANRDTAAREAARCHPDVTALKIERCHVITTGGHWDESVYQDALGHLRAMNAQGCGQAMQAKHRHTGTSLAQELQAMVGLRKRHQEREAQAKQQLYERQRQEDDRLAAERRRKEEEQQERDRAAAAAQEEYQREIEGRMKKAGLKGVLYGEGIAFVIEALKNGEMTIDEVRRVAIELHDDADSDFQSIQVIDRQNALYANSDQSVILLLRRTGDQLFEGSPLLAIRNHYVVLVDVVEYQTRLGSRQAYVIEMAW
jgi:hypothetical protein